MSIGQQLIKIYEALKENSRVKNKKEFCQLLGIEPKHFSKYVNNTLKFEINEENYKKIRALNINIDWIFTNDGEIFHSEQKNESDFSFKEMLTTINKLAEVTYSKKKIIDFILDNTVSNDQEVLNYLKKLKMID